ncbi:MAG: phosphoglycolate phosphatase [Hyphomicrobiales bacterium]
MFPAASPSAIIFDLDGTLVNTAPDLAAVLNRVLERHGRAALASEIVQTIIGRGAHTLLQRAFARTGAPIADDAAMETLYREFHDDYTGNIAFHSHIFPDAIPVLETFRAREIPLGVCTNKPEKAAVALLDELGLRGVFDSLVGGDTLRVGKPDPRPVREVLRQLRADTARAIFVGDSETDVLAARAAGLGVICVSFGYSECPVATFNPDAVIDSFAELPGAVEAIINADKI